MYSDELLLPWLRVLMEEHPDLMLLDAHTHLGGNDPDGSRLSANELLDALSPTGGRAVTFPLMEPGGYRAANDAVLAAAAASGGRLVPFCRVNPRDNPVAELERCLSAGARGVKLHPRAESFDLRHAGVEAVVTVAAKHKVPVIFHSGMGIPSLGQDALTLAERFPSAPIILAHGAVTDLSWIWQHLPDHPNLFIDTAWWNPADHLALFSLAPPGHILLASDTPYGTPTAAAIVALRCALEAGLSETQLQAVAGGQLERLLAGQRPLNLGPAPGPPPQRHPLAERVLTLLVGAMATMLAGASADPLLSLARLACRTDTSLAVAPVLQQVAELLDRQSSYAQRHETDGRRPPGFHLVLVAAAVAAAPSAPLPAPA